VSKKRRPTHGNDAWRLFTRVKLLIRPTDSPRIPTGTFVRRVSRPMGPYPRTRLWSVPRALPIGRHRIRDSIENVGRRSIHVKTDWPTGDGVGLWLCANRCRHARVEIGLVTSNRRNLTGFMLLVVVRSKQTMTGPIGIYRPSSHKSSLRVSSTNTMYEKYKRTRGQTDITAGVLVRLVARRCFQCNY